MPYEGPNLANQHTRKSVVFGRKFGEASPYFIVILRNIIGKKYINVQMVSFHKVCIK